jgi:hypothetical protein
MKAKLFVVLIVVFMAGGCMAMGHNVAVDPSARAYVSFPAERLSTGNFSADKVTLKSFQGADWLQIGGQFGLEYYGWNASKEYIASDVYNRMIPDYVRQISGLFGPNMPPTGFNITARTNVILDKQMHFNEILYSKTGKRMGPFPSPRAVETIDFYVDKNTADRYKDFRIDNRNLRANMVIVIDNQERIP